MLDKELDQLVDYLKEMIADGVQLVHGGHLIDWHDTNIPEILAEIDRKKQEAANFSVEVSDALVNRVSGEKAYVFYEYPNGNVAMSLSTESFIYPKDKILYHYRRELPGD